MGKFRTNLKRNKKGKSWARGQSGITNPENQKHRNRARSRYLRSDLNCAPGPQKPSQLTLDAVFNHEARQSFANGGEPTVNDVAQSLKSFNFNNDSGMTETKGGTFKTFQTFASNYTACTNISFQKLLNGFRCDSEQHKEMLAILAAVTEIINERGGTQSSTEFYLALMETLEASKEDSDINATLSLLVMGIKTVPQTILRRKFSDSCKILLDLMEQYIESDNQNIIRNVIGCLSVILKAQEYSIWNLSATIKVFDSILAFVTHSKPKIRKSAQHAITSIIHGSCFMAPPPNNEDENNIKTTTIKYHPCGNRVMKYCSELITPDNLANNQTIILHILVLLQDTINGLKPDDIKIICELLLSMMTATNILIRTTCFHTFHSLFQSKTNNMTSILVGKLLTAIYDYRPERNDIRQTLAWITVMKQGYISLANLDLNLCNNMLPKLIEILTDDLWLSERIEIQNTTTTILRELLEECVKPCSLTLDSSNRNRQTITKIIVLITNTLNRPFIGGGGNLISQIILTIGILYKSCGKLFSDSLKESLQMLGRLYDTFTNYQIQIEHTIMIGIELIGVENVLNAIPLTDLNGNVLINKSWLLPLLRESIKSSTLEYFTNFILKLASNCNQNWLKYKNEGNQTLGHTYELLCCQLWSLFPGFCRQPKDPQNFKFLAKTLGMILNENPELRSPVLDGLKELIMNGDDNCKNELKKYAKNFLPRLFNIYTTKPQGTYEIDIRNQTFIVIQEYLKISPQEILDEMFETAMEQLKSSTPGLFLTDAIFDIVEKLSLYQTKTKLQNVYDKFITVILRKKQKNNFVATDDVKLKKQQRKAYKLLQDILTNDNIGCVEFVTNQMESIGKLLLASHGTTCESSRPARIVCLKIYLDKQENLTTSNELIQPILLESIMALHDFMSKENTAEDIIKMIGDIYQAEDLLNDYIDIIIAGLAGDSIMIKNTIYCLKVVVKHLTGNLTIKTLEFILEQILIFLISKNRNESEASISFLMTFVKVLPSPLVANHLEKIVKSISSIPDDSKRGCRLQLGYILKKLCIKFGPTEIINFVPGNDEGTHKRLKAIRKTLSKEQRLKYKHKDKNDDDTDDDDDGGIVGSEKKSQTIDEILADSDSDSDFDTNDKNEQKQTKKNKKRHETYIQETPETIIDLNDINSIGKISSSRPEIVKSSDELNNDGKKIKKDTNRGFKLANDGRLIIDDKFSRNNDDDKDDDDDEEDDDDDENKMQIDGDNDNMFKKKKRGVAEDSDSDDNDDNENNTGGGISRKRKATDSRSMLSGKSGMTSKTGATSSKYMSGGKGIHRSMAPESMKSGKTNQTVGSTYKAKKAKGDVKKKGQLDPYAYIPLSRSNLNKRKHAKNVGQFKSIVIGAKKGAVKGTKNRVHKSYRK